MKHAGTNDWIELPADNLDSFMDMIERAKDAARENLQTIEHKVCELVSAILRCSSAPNNIIENIREHAFG